MEQRVLGNTGLQVSRLALGTMTWGRDTDEHEARDQFNAFRDAGGTFFDTASGYTEGDSERLLGRLVRESSARDEVVIATKAGIGRRGTDRVVNVSRAYLLAALDTSLKRLEVDYIDLWQIHIWQDTVPLEETLGALDQAVSSGRVAYAGISNYNGWQTAQAATWQKAVPGRATLASTQVEYSLLNRSIEHEVVPAAQALGLGILPWSPLGRGILTGKYRTGIPSNSRAASDHLAGFVSSLMDERAGGIVEAVAKAADGLGWTPLEVALSWVRDRPGVVAPVIGARTAAQLRESLASEECTLPPELVAALDDVSN